MTQVFQNEDHLGLLANNVINLRKQVGLIKGKQLRSKTFQLKVKNLVQQYFRTTRTELIRMKIDLKDMDLYMQRLLGLTSRDSLTLGYKINLKLIEKEIPKIEIKRELYLSEVQLPNKDNKNNTEIDRRILATLSDLIPSAALSYQQVLVDLEDKHKISFRGTAAEIREILREVLDHLAPDKDVVSSDGFSYEKDSKGNALTTSTMKQKTRFILRSRGLSKTAVKTPESVVKIIEDSIADFTRSTYDRGSLSTHVATKRPEVKQLKSYVETILCELLEIHHQED